MNLSERFSSEKPAMHVIARAIACGMLLVLSSCQIPPLRRSEPAPPLPGNYEAAANSGVSIPGANGLENSAQLGIEEFYNDPMLTGMIHLAVMSNRELKMMNEEVQIARNEILSRQGAYLPFVGFRANAGLDKPSQFTPLGAAEKDLEYLPGKHFPDPLGNFMLSLNVFWHPDLFRALRNARDAAALRYRAVTERRNYFVTRLVADIAESYYRLMALDNRLKTLDQTIAFQQRSLDIAIAQKAAGRGTELAVQRFQAEVRRNQSEKPIIQQDIVETENRINFLANRFPETVPRKSAGYLDLTIHALSVGVPSQLLQNRPDVRQAERELLANGLDVQIARSRFFPDLTITGAVGYQAFSPQYLFYTPGALIYNVMGDVVAPLVNKKAIQADYLSANARQLESIYNYQRVVLNAFTEVINRVTMVENYRKSIEVKKLQLAALDASVATATKLFQNPRIEARVEYLEVLLALRDRQDATMVLIETKRQQLFAVVNTYQALGGGDLLSLLNKNPLLFRLNLACLVGGTALVTEPSPALPEGNPQGGPILPAPKPLDVSKWIQKPLE